jgi:hypothetical protein
MRLLPAAIWAAVLTLVALVAHSVESGPYDPWRQISAAPTSASPPPSTSSAKRRLLIHSPWGWSSDTRLGDGRYPLILPPGWQTVLDTPERIVGFTALTRALSQAEDRALLAPQVIDYTRDTSFSVSDLHYSRWSTLGVYPIWDIDPAIFATPDHERPFRSALNWVQKDIANVTFERGAVVVSADPEGHRHADLFFQAVRRERDVLTREASSPPDDALDAVFSTAALEPLPGEERVHLEQVLAFLKPGRHWALSQGWFLAQGAPSELAELRQRLSDARLLRAVRHLQRRGSVGMAFCQGSLWDDDPFIGRLAFEILLDQFDPFGSRGPDLLRAWPARTDAWPLRGPGTFFEDPRERARQLKLLVDTTVDPDALTTILANHFSTGGPECRQAAHAGIVARLPLGVLAMIRRENHHLFVPDGEKEAFLSALVDRLQRVLESAVEPADRERAVRVTGEALDLAHAGLVAQQSAALRRLDQLSGWAVLHRPVPGPSAPVPSRQ